jgi:hypothetical protein
MLLEQQHRWPQGVASIVCVPDPAFAAYPPRINKTMWMIKRIVPSLSPTYGPPK